jgi:hypothetical protein
MTNTLGGRLFLLRDSFLAEFVGIDGHAVYVS